MTELLNYLRSYASGRNYIAEDALYGAQENGLINDFTFIESEIGDEMSWGFIQHYIFKINDDFHIELEVYIVTGDDGDNEFYDVSLVKPIEVLVTKWVPA